MLVLLGIWAYVRGTLPDLYKRLEISVPLGGVGVIGFSTIRAVTLAARNLLNFDVWCCCQFKLKWINCRRQDARKLHVCARGPPEDGLQQVRIAPDSRGFIRL